MIQLINNLLSISNSKFLLIGVAIGALYYFFAFDNGSNIQSKGKVLQKELKTMKKELQKFEEILRNKEKYGDMLPQLLKSIEHVIQYLPEDFTLNHLIDALTTQLKASGTQVISIQNAKKSIYPKNPNIEEISIDVVLRGNYSQILTFLSLLTKLKLILRVKNMELLFEKQLPEEKSPVLRMNSVIIAYRYIDEEENENLEQKKKVSS